MKKILNAGSFINKILSSTQRKTPTLIHKRFSIERIRKFYIRKIKFVQQNFVNKISETLNSFPSVDYIHPFFGKLLNLMFQRQHYKLALYKLSKSKYIIDTISKNFVKLVKNGNSSYACKQLKKEALGRICTVIKKLDKSLIFLEKIRVHLVKLPEIDPHRKSIVLCGCPNAGKSSYLNKTTRANIKIGNREKKDNLILLGHMQINFSRLQILDTNGINRSIIYNQNSFGVQLFNIFLNLDCIVLHFFDFTEFCSTSLSNQINVFRILNDLNPDLKKILVLSKIDLGWEKFVKRTQKSGLNFLQKKNAIYKNLLKISSHDEIGLYSIKQLLKKVIFNPKIDVCEYKEKFELKFHKYTPGEITLNSNQCAKKFGNPCMVKKKNFNSRTGIRQKIYFSENRDYTPPLTSMYEIKIQDYRNGKNCNLLQGSQEKEQKNREIKTEKIYTAKKIPRPRKNLKVEKNFILIDKNRNRFTHAIS